MLNDKPIESVKIKKVGGKALQIHLLRVSPSSQQATNPAEKVDLAAQPEY